MESASNIARVRTPLQSCRAMTAGAPITFLPTKSAPRTATNHALAIPVSGAAPPMKDFMAILF